MLLYSPYEVYRGSTRSGSTCAVCDADEIRVQVAKLFQRVVDYGNIVVLFRWENLEREHGVPVLE